MSVLDPQQRARRRRIEAGLLASLTLAVTAAAAGLYVTKLSGTLIGAGAVLAGPGLFGR